MKKAYIYLSDVALFAAALAGCTKDNHSGEMTVITVSLPDDAGTRTSYDYDEVNKLLKVTWVSGDKIGVYSSDTDTQPKIFTVQNIHADGKCADFTGTLPSGTGPFTVVYPYKYGLTSSEVLGSVLDGPQDGTLANLSRLDVMTGSLDAATLKVSSLSHRIAVIRVISPTTANQSGVSIRGAWGERHYYASSTANTSYIAVPTSTNATKSLYASVYAGSVCHCYAKTNDTEKSIPEGKMVKFDCSSIAPIDYPVTGIIGGHEYVTIDGQNWATCNIGACVPWEYGDHYNFGSFNVQTASNVEIYYTGTEDLQGKLNLTLNDNTTIGGDVAAYKWGNGWKMPNATVEPLSGQLDKLFEKNLGYTTLAGVNGRKFGYADAYVFIPSSGWTDDCYLTHQGSECRIWSSSHNANYAYFLSFGESSVSMKNNVSPLKLAMSVRPIHLGGN